MNERELSILKALLTFLDGLQGGQVVEPIMHASVQTSLRNQGEMAPSLAEFNRAVLDCDRRGWIIGVPSRVTKQMKWSLSDEGRAALVEL
jgi:hypothetical protein